MLCFKTLLSVYIFYNIVEYKVLSHKISDFMNAAEKIIICQQLENNVSKVTIGNIDYYIYIYIYTRAHNILSTAYTSRSCRFRNAYLIYKCMRYAYT